MKKHFLSIMIFCSVILLSLGVGVFSLNYQANLFASASAQEIEVYKDEAPENLIELQTASDGQLEYWATNLDKFDGREFDYITSEKNQGGMGICWAYAAVGAVEANILRDSVDPEVDKTTLDLDEMIAAYGRFNRDGENDPLYLTTNDTYRSDTWKSSGDFAHNAFMAMTQGFLLVDQVSSEWWTESAYKRGLSQSKYFVQGFKQIDHTEEAIKRAILEYGSVTMEYKAPETMSQQYVNHVDTKAGHASLIIGWDDSLSSTLFWPDKASSNGAWIVKNSWGPGGDAGVNGTHCFYLSYDAYMTDNLYVVDMGLREDYQNIYYYDGSISDNTMQYTADAYGAIYEAKLTSANQQEKLTAVSFGIWNNKATVNIDVYKLEEVNFANVNSEINKPDSGQLIGYKHDVYFEDDGFYTVDFDVPIDLQCGEIFSIVISGRDSNNGYLHPYFAQDYIDSINDMTYMKYGNEWTSFKGYKDSYPGKTAGSCVRLRAITNVVKTSNSYDNDLSQARIELDSRLVYYEKGKSQTSTFMVYIGNRILQEDEDYEVDYLNNSEPGIATVTINGIGDYHGEKSTTFEIAKPEYPPGMITGGQIEIYSNTNSLYQVPVPDGWKWGETQDITLKTGLSDWGYQLKYIGNDAQFYQKLTYSVKIYKNSTPRPLQVNLEGSTVTINGKYSYTGSEIQPDVWVVCKGHELKFGSDYTVQYQNNTDYGTAKIIITGQGAYTGQVTKEFQIRKAKWPNKRPKSIIYVDKDTKNLSQISLDCPGWTWQKHFELTSDEVQATAIYTGTGASNYANTKMIVTIIRESETGQKNIAKISELRLERTEYVYSGQAWMPNVIAWDGEIELSKGTDFNVQYQDNTEAGQASVVITGINSYTGSTTLTFNIARADRDDFKVILEGWTYGQTAQEPSIEGYVENAKVTYSYSTSRDGSYSTEKPKNAGSYWIKAVIDASRNYNAAENITQFTISKADNPSNTPRTELTISRKAKTLQDVELNAEGWEWETPSTKITGKTLTAKAVYFDKENYVNYTVQITLTKADPKDVSLLSVVLDVKSFVYNGTERKPNVVAKDDDILLVLGEDYDVEYQDNKNAGQGKAIVTFKNDYEGTTELLFTISKAEKPTVKNNLIRIEHKVTKLSEIKLPDGFVWKDGDLEITSDKMLAVAIYVGDDANNYISKEVDFTIVIETQNGINSLDWLVIVIPIAILLIGYVVYTILRHKRNKWKNHI